jgi:hypothetical protein
MGSHLRPSDDPERADEELYSTGRQDADRGA